MLPKLAATGVATTRQTKDDLEERFVASISVGPILGLAVPWTRFGKTAIGSRRKPRGRSCTAEAETREPVRDSW